MQRGRGEEEVFGMVMRATATSKSRTPASVCFTSNSFHLHLSLEDQPWATGAALPAGTENQKFPVVLHCQHLPSGRSQEPMIDWCESMKV